MNGRRFFALFIWVIATPAAAQSFQVSISSPSFQTTPVFSDVTTFAFRIVVTEALVAGATYDNPPISAVNYEVSGTLEPGTPSGFPSFALQRSVTGVEFYAQGSSLSFQISPNAVLSDGLQVAELVGGGIVFRFNGREIDTGRFHPALLELNANGTGRIQNSNNVPSLNPLNEVDFGEEYITDLAFDPGNLTLVAIQSRGGGGGSSVFGGLSLFALTVIAVLARRGIRKSCGR